MWFEQGKGVGSSPVFVWSCGMSTKDQYIRYHRNSQYKALDVVCPMCGRKHKAMVHFDGKTIPKKFCEPCRRKRKNLSSSFA